MMTVAMSGWNGAHALWAGLSNSELIEASDLIVVGTLGEFTRVTNPVDGRKRTVGVIEIERVLKGDPGAKTVWLDGPQPGTPLSSSDIVYKTGQKGLWFLRLLTPGRGAIYTADHPQRFVPFSSAGPNIEAVRKYLEP